MREEREYLAPGLDVVIGDFQVKAARDVHSWLRKYTPVHTYTVCANLNTLQIHEHVYDK